MPEDRRGQFQVLLGIIRLVHARQRGDPQAVAEEAQRQQAAAEARELVPPALDQDLHALALVSLGSAEVWTTRLEEARRHLEEGVALARRNGRPFLEFRGLVHQAVLDIYRSFGQAAERSREPIELARRHGWTDEPAAGTAYSILGTALVWQGRLEEAEPWVQRAERIVRAEAEPAMAVGVYYVRGLLELARGRDADALAALRAAERLAGRLAVPHQLVPRVRAVLVHALVRLGETERAEEALTGLGERDGGGGRAHGETRIATAMLRLAKDDPDAAAAALAPVLNGSGSGLPWGWLARAFLVEAIARDALGDDSGTGRALERALDCAEPDGALLPFLLHPVAGLLERHAGHATTHAALIAEIQALLAGRDLATPPAGPRPLSEPLRESELRVLRYLPTNLTAPEIAAELYVSRHTVKTHIRSLYAKLGTHRRAEAVARARELGLLAPATRRR